MGRLGPKERRFLAEILLRLHHARLSARRRGAFRGRLCAARTTRSTISRRRSAPSASRSTASAADEISMAKLLTLLFEVTELFDMRTRPELILLQKTMVVVEGVAPLARPAARHVVDGRSGGARLDRAQSRAARAARRSRHRCRSTPQRRRDAAGAVGRAAGSPSGSRRSRRPASSCRPPASRRSAAPRRGARAGAMWRCG